MKALKLVFDAQFCGHDEITIIVPDYVSDKTAEALFEPLLGMEYDENCRYETYNLDQEINFSAGILQGALHTFEHLNTEIPVVTIPWNPSQCPTCKMSFEEFEPCNDGYYQRACGMERCPACGQKLDWRNANE